MQKLIKPSEVATILNISLDRTYSLAREGVIPSVRLNKSLRFCPEEISNFIKQGGTKIKNN